MLVAILWCIWIVIKAVQTDDQMPTVSLTQRKAVLSLCISAKTNDNGIVSTTIGFSYSR